MLVVVKNGPKLKRKSDCESAAIQLIDCRERWKILSRGLIEKHKSVSTLRLSTSANRHSNTKIQQLFKNCVEEKKDIIVIV